MGNVSGRFGRFVLGTGEAERIFLCPENIEIDDSVDRVWVGAWVLLDGSHGKIRIGGGSVISCGVSVYTHDNSQVPGGGAQRVGDVLIGRGVFVGTGVVIEPDVVIGDGAVVGALSLVRRGSRIPGGARWWGAPAAPAKEA